MSFGSQSIRSGPMPGAGTSPTAPSVRPIGPFLGSAGGASSRHSRNGDGPIIGDRVPCPAIEGLRTVDLGHSSDGPSWIDLVAIRLNTTESRFLTCLNRHLQQNPPIADVMEYGTLTHRVLTTVLTTSNSGPAHHSNNQHFTFSSRQTSPGPCLRSNRSVPARSRTSRAPAC